MKTIVLAVTNDLANDQRVLKVISTLKKSDSSIVFIGRRLKGSRNFESNDFNIVRFKLFFNRKFLFYAEFNIRLFLYLLFRKIDVLVANDLDTLPAMYAASRIKSKPLVYDAHEYFTGAYEMSDRPFVRKFWEKTERRILPRLLYFMTVNESIAGLYKNKYGITPVVVRNLAKYRETGQNPEKLSVRIKNRKYFIIQGTGLNQGRGLEEAVLAMKLVEDALLVIVGSGLALDFIKTMTQEERLHEKVVMIDTLPYEELKYITASAIAGLSLDKPIGLNYRFSLPNKISDYIQARIPVIASDLPEVSNILNEYEIGLICHPVDPRSIAECMILLLNEEGLARKFKKNTEKAAKELCWEKEERKVIALYKRVGIHFD